MDHNSSGVGANKIRSKKQLTIDVAAFRLETEPFGINANDGKPFGALWLVAMLKTQMGPHQQQNMFSIHYVERVSC